MPNVTPNPTPNAAPHVTPQAAPKAPLTKQKLRYFFARQGRAITGVALCLVVLATAAFYGSVRHRRSEDPLSGKWSADIPWRSASGRDYAQTMHTALFFLPGGVFGTVLTFPGGAVGGTGTYRANGGRLTVRCTGMSVVGHAVPLSLFADKPWFRDTASYRVAYDGSHLTLTPADPGPTPAPGYPLLVSPKPLVLSRVEQPAAPPPAPAPKE